MTAELQARIDAEQAIKDRMAARHERLRVLGLEMSPNGDLRPMGKTAAVSGPSAMAAGGRSVGDVVGAIERRQAEEIAREKSKHNNASIPSRVNSERSVTHARASGESRTASGDIAASVKRTANPKTKHRTSLDSVAEPGANGSRDLPKASKGVREVPGAAGTGDGVSASRRPVTLPVVKGEVVVGSLRFPTVLHNVTCEALDATAGDFTVQPISSAAERRPTRSKEPGSSPGSAPTRRETSQSESAQPRTKKREGTSPKVEVTEPERASPVHLTPCAHRWQRVTSDKKGPRVLLCRACGQVKEEAPKRGPPISESTALDGHE